jgi:hypothetical protein
VIDVLSRDHVSDLFVYKPLPQDKESIENILNASEDDLTKSLLKNMNIHLQTVFEFDSLLETDDTSHLTAEEIAESEKEYKEFKLVGKKLKGSASTRTSSTSSSRNIQNSWKANQENPTQGDLEPQAGSISIDSLMAPSYSPNEIPTQYDDSNQYENIGRIPSMSTAESVYSHLSSSIYSSRYSQDFSPLSSSSLTSPINSSYPNSYASSSFVDPNLTQNTYRMPSNSSLPYSNFSRPGSNRSYQPTNSFPSMFGTQNTFHFDPSFRSISNANFGASSSYPDPVSSFPSGSFPSPFRSDTYPSSTPYSSPFPSSTPPPPSSFIFPSSTPYRNQIPESEHITLPPMYQTPPSWPGETPNEFNTGLS